ncbi:hypothetical protein JJV70_15135 [Streptomyces sp. JJ66]|uniref:hypothetical protein n=1 Tax=Streptomyces sp. JJ66 TaxID=2803843 RepID=UPI001C58854D|nr:hypothetical protein [Streptomyces sp. JJ66]MBW1603413.1 hypothetical protein [Streptomyces sp. JJ66]
MNRPRSPLLYPAALLSAASLAWTTWSLVDLLGAGWIGVTVATGADIIWASVIVAEYRGLRIGNRAWIVPALGWAALLTVAGFLAWHGIDRDSAAMAVAGPFLPLGAKVVWLLALADMRDPAALTDDEQHQLADMERGMAFERARHRIDMERREMQAELLLSEVSVDFDIELARQERGRELARRRPIELPAAEPPAHRREPTAHPAEPLARHPEPKGSPAPAVLVSEQVTAPEPPARPEPATGRPFGFATSATAQSAQRAQAVAQVAELVAQDAGITSAQVAELLSVSPATAKRYLREARGGAR